MAQDYRKTLQARRDRRKNRGSASSQAREAAGEPVQQRGGFGMSVQPGGRQQSGGPGIGQLASKYGPKVAQMGKIGYDMMRSPTFNRGSSEGAYQDYRAGERADYAPAAVAANQGSMPGVFGNFPNAPGPMPQYTPDMTFSMPTGGMDIGSAPASVGSFGAESGAGATAGAAGSALAGGAGSLTSMGVGMIPGLIGGFAGADPTTMAALNTLGAVAAPAAGGAVAGTVAGTGAAAGASAGMAAAAPLAMVVGPYLVAKLIQGIHAGMDKKNLHQLQQRVNSIYAQLPGELNTLKGIPALTSQLTRSSSPEEAAGILKQLNTIQSNFQNNGWESAMKSGVSQVDTIGEGQAEAEIPGVQKSLMDYGGAFFPYMDAARLRGQDLLEKSGWDSAKIQEQTGRYISPQEWAQNLGGETYNSSEQGNLGSGGGPQSVRYNDYMTENFQKPGQARDAAAQAQADMEANMRAANGENVNFANPGNYRPNSQGGMWSPEALAAFSEFQPGETESGLNKMFGGQWSPAMEGQNLGGGLPGAMPGSEIGGAGKRSPQFLTPELDNRVEAGTGKLGGGRPGVSDPGTPFGMGGAKRGGGMQVGAQQGGRPGGQSPFGGMSRQTMQPQQGGGIQAQRRQPNGVV